MQKLAQPLKQDGSEPDRAPMEEMLRELIDEVRADALEAPEAYLAETVVPRGGE